jgi:hypothetical protein
VVPSGTSQAPSALVLYRIIVKRSNMAAGYRRDALQKLRPGAFLCLLLIIFSLVSAQPIPGTPSFSDVYGRQLGEQLQQRFPYCVADG